MSHAIAGRLKNVFRKKITFDGGTGSGAIGTIAIATCTGRIIVERGTVYCSTSLAGASATVEMGVSGNTAAWIAQTTATDIDAGDFWKDATPEPEVSGRITRALAGDLILTVATAAVTAGVIEIVFPWWSMSDDGKVA